MPWSRSRRPSSFAHGVATVVLGRCWELFCVEKAVNSTAASSLGSMHRPPRVTGERLRACGCIAVLALLHEWDDTATADVVKARRIELAVPGCRTAVRVR